MNAVIAQNTAGALPVVNSDESSFALAQRKALALSNSTLVPAQYRGRDNMPNVLIALEIAERIGASPLQVMQNLYIVQGKPSWSSSFLIATVNACGRFHPMRFEVVGTDPTKDDYKVRAFADDKATGERCIGPWVTWAMVKAEGWLSKNGSKWKTMPELMFLYRAAGFWSRVYAPEVSMGILTQEEAHDVWGGAPTSYPGATDHSNLKALEAQLTGAGEQSPADEPELVSDALTPAEVRAQMEGAADMDALNDAFDLVRDLPPADHPDLIDLYNARREALELP